MTRAHVIQYSQGEKLKVKGQLKRTARVQVCGFRKRGAIRFNRFFISLIPSVPFQRLAFIGKEERGFLPVFAVVIKK